MISPFYAWCQKVLPLVYDQSISYYEVLCKVADVINLLIDEINTMQQDLDKLPMLEKAIADMQAEIDKIKNGEYIENHIEALRQWIDENMKKIVCQTVKYVFFGLTDDGRFAAYVPDSWNFIRFDTGYDPECPRTFMHLLLWY